MQNDMWMWEAYIKWFEVAMLKTARQSFDIVYTLQDTTNSTISFDKMINFFYLRYVHTVLEPDSRNNRRKEPLLIDSSRTILHLIDFTSHE